MRRREFLAAPAVLGAQQADAIVIEPQPLFDISPWLYMQFMEPLGVTDGSVEAAWDYDNDDWRRDLIETTKDLAPGVMRFGGNYSRYYKWREGVGPVAQRPRMRNYDWGGWETNRVGTREFVDFCRRVGAEPLYCVNFMSDGHRRYWNAREGNRSGDAQEAAEWVSYCGDSVRLWQIGNETSYGTGGFTKDEAITHTIEFAKAMHARNSSIKLIGWGDWSRSAEQDFWAADMAERAGDYVDLIAMHLMGQVPRRKDTVLRGNRYQFAPEQAWEELLELASAVEAKVSAVERILAAKRFRGGIAVTEGHLSLRPPNTNPLLSEWLSAVYHARSMNIYQRHGANVKIATAADFCGNRWTVNAVMIGGTTYLMPAGSVMRLFKRHNGTHGVAVKSAPAGLDIAASRTGDKLYLHVANTSYSRAAEASFAVAGMTLKSGRVFEIAPESPRQAVSVDEPDVFKPREKSLGADFRWRFPATSVSAVELEL